MTNEIKVTVNRYCLDPKNTIDIDNLIYYSHTDRWVFGWKRELTIGQIDTLSMKLNQLRDKLGAKFCDSIEWKQRKTA